MGEIGKVVAVDTKSGGLTISLKRGAACEGCKVCSMGLADKEMLMEAENLCGAVNGDMVEVALRDGYLIRAALILYGVPLLALLAGAAIGTLLFESELWVFALGVGLMAATYLIIRLAGKNWDLRAYRPMAVRVANDETIS